MHSNPTLVVLMDHCLFLVILEVFLVLCWHIYCIQLVYKKYTCWKSILPYEIRQVLPT